jgi:hypothetical protein
VEAEVLELAFPELEVLEEVALEEAEADGEAAELSASPDEGVLTIASVSEASFGPSSRTAATPATVPTTVTTPRLLGRGSFITCS